METHQSQNVHQDRLRVAVLSQKGAFLSSQERTERRKILQEAAVGKYEPIQAKLKWLKNIYMKSKQPQEAALIDDIEKAE